MTSKLIDFNEHRKRSIEAKRRNFERVFFKDLIGCETVIDDHGTGYPVDIVDISYKGCLLQVPENKNNERQFPLGKEITVRIHLTKTSFMPCLGSIRHGRPFTDSHGKKFMRYGLEFDTSLPSYKAIESLVQFIYDYAEYSTTDKGESKVYFL